MIRQSLPLLATGAFACPSSMPQPAEAQRNERVLIVYGER